MIDGKENWDVTGVVLKDREILSTDGVMIVAVGVHAKTKEIINGPDVQTRGVVYLKDAETGREGSRCDAGGVHPEAVKEKRYDNMEVRKKRAIGSRAFWSKKLGKRPMVLPVILEINA